MFCGMKNRVSILTLPENTEMMPLHSPVLKIRYTRDTIALFMSVILIWLLLKRKQDSVGVSQGQMDSQWTQSKCLITNPMSASILKISSCLFLVVRTNILKLINHSPISSSNADCWNYKNCYWNSLFVVIVMIFMTCDDVIEIVILVIFENDFMFFLLHQIGKT